jgi:hypothetical protein
MLDYKSFIQLFAKKLNQIAYYSFVTEGVLPCCFL